MSGRPGQLGSKPTTTVPRFTETFLDEMDGRDSTVRALRARLRVLTGDLGGQASLSYMELSLSKRAVHMESEIEKMEKILMFGRRVDINQYTNLVATFSGLLSKIQPGLKRRVKVLTLQNYLAEKSSETTPITPCPVKVVKTKEPDAG